MGRETFRIEDEVTASHQTRDHDANVSGWTSTAEFVAQSPEKSAEQGAILRAPFGDVAQLAERYLCKVDVRGSIPLVSTLRAASPADVVRVGTFGPVYLAPSLQSLVNSREA